MLAIKMPCPSKIRLLQMHMETNSSSHLTLKWLIVQHPITKQASETDYVTKLLSTITTELPNPQYHHQKFQMLSIKSQTYP